MGRRAFSPPLFSYLIEARDQDEAVEIAKRFPSAPYAKIEVRPTRQLEVS